MVSGGKACAVDEITVHMDAPKAQLKQNCHRYKRAGDGMQADALCKQHGYLLDFIWRGDPQVPFSYNHGADKEGVRNRVNLLLSRSLNEDYHEMYWDNLYGNVKWMQAMVKGQSLAIKVYHRSTGAKPLLPGGAATMRIKKVRTCGTMRGNSGIQHSGLKMGKDIHEGGDRQGEGEGNQEAKCCGGKG
jgi:hypothetical protein